MKRLFGFFLFFFPLICFGQIDITGKVLNQADNKPLAGASVFLNNTVMGASTESDGSFVIKNVKPGSYQLIVSMVGFNTYNSAIIVDDAGIKLPVILLRAKPIMLNSVSVTYHSDPNRDEYMQWFKDQFLGTSFRAEDCRILNPDMLDLSFDDQAKKLTASSVDFLEIENDALGYQLRYLLTNFSFVDGDEKKIYYEGPVMFRELRGSPQQERRWGRNRLEVYENSPMHFLRAALANRLDEENFRVQLYAISPNPARPADSIINAKINYYQQLKQQGRGQADSLAFWNKKSKLPATLVKLMPDPLHKSNIIQPTDKPGEYALMGDKGSLYVSYSPAHHFHISDKIENLYNPSNKENTLINFNQATAFFDANGVLLNPYSVEYFGVWGRDRVAELLPVDYEPPATSGMEAKQLLPDVDSTLSKYLAERPVEKAYLQFDKSYYAAGDTMYFKAYVTAGEQNKLSGLSGLLHVELINTKNKIDQAIKLKLDSGISWGDFALPDSLPGGSYHVRAYTQWMRNEGEYYFFDKVVPIGAVKPVKIPESLAKQQAAGVKPEIQFLPEGGSLITGINTRIAFKAIGPTGLGVGVKGIVVDNEDKPVTTFASAHLGMGSFAFTPAEGKTYSAKITWPNGLQDKVDLPRALDEGISLSVNNDLFPNAQVFITANPAFFKQHKGQDYTLLMYAGGLITSVDCVLDSPKIKVDILKKKLQTGIATVTLFSADHQPLCERLFFIQNYDRLAINVDGTKKSYTSREKVDLNLNVLNRRSLPAEGHFSVAVVNESIAPDNDPYANNILSQLLLTSELKGYIEEPGYYFADTSASARTNLDLLMLTQGYRRFEWKQALDTAKHVQAYQPEQTLTVAGRVDNLSNEPVAGGTINLIPLRDSILTQTTDDKGLFQFKNLFFADTAYFMLNAVTTAGKNNTKITYFNDAKDAPRVTAGIAANSRQISDTTLAAYVDNDKAQLKEVRRYLIKKAVMLKQVNIQGKKPDNEYYTLSLAGAGNADQVMHADEIGEVPGLLINGLNGRLPGVMFVSLSSNPSYKIPFLTVSPKGYKSSPMLIIVDGAPSSADELNLLNSNEVETVEVLKFAGASMYGMEGGGGVLVITTKRNQRSDEKDIASIGILPITVTGFYKARQFYSPKYDNPALVTKQRDLRSTIYWNPEIKTGKDGNARFDFYNADGTGTYKVTIEGIDKDGNIGRQVFEYEVK